MHIVKVVGMILLAIYIFFMGLAQLTGMSLPAVGHVILGLVGVAAGILIFIASCCRRECV